jgi:hypothetical protein
MNNNLKMDFEDFSMYMKTHLTISKQQKDERNFLYSE